MHDMNLFDWNAVIAQLLPHGLAWSHDCGTARDRAVHQPIIEHPAGKSQTAHRHLVSQMPATQLHKSSGEAGDPDPAIARAPLRPEISRAIRAHRHMNGDNDF